MEHIKLTEITLIYSVVNSLYEQNLAPLRRFQYVGDITTPLCVLNATEGLFCVIWLITSLFMRKSAKNTFKKHNATIGGDYDPPMGAVCFVP